LIKDKNYVSNDPYLIPAYISDPIVDKIIASLSALDGELDPVWLAHFLQRKF
jgi:hypothetical protein